MKWKWHTPMCVLVGVSRWNEWMQLHLALGFLEFEVTNASADWHGSIDFLFGIGGKGCLWFGPFCWDWRGAYQ
jgi:hypothetical protein